MVKRWIQANADAEAERNWRKHLGPFYAVDAEYRWGVGHKEEFVALGRTQIEQWALDVQIRGFEAWTYPYQRVIIDECRGEVVAYWKQVAPFRRKDGRRYEVAGLCSSWFRYAGDFKWSRQEDFFDLGNIVALLAELAADGHLNEIVKRKIQSVAHGRPLSGHRPLAHGKQSLFRKIQCQVAMAKIAVLGR